MGNDITNFCGCGNNLTSNTNEAQLTHNNIEKLQTDQNSQTPIPFNNYNEPDFKEKSDIESIQPNQEQNEYIDKVCKIQKQYRKHKQLLSTKETQLNNYASNQSNSLLKTISFTYTGSKDINGNKQGFGIQKWTDSSKYIGQFNENKAAGIGIFFHPDGDIYQGEFSGDRANGYGEYIHKNGAIYYGLWNNDSQYDIGYELWNDNSTYTGLYMNGKKDGIGTYIWQDQTMYQGEWKENLIEGYGIYYFTDGKSYIGQWKGNKMNGYGEFSWKDGRKYCGFYSNDKKNGFGIHYWPNGEKYYVGFWKDGKQHGVGKYIKDNDMKYGEWVEGKKERWFNNENELEMALSGNESNYKYFIMKDISEIKAYVAQQM